MVLFHFLATLRDARFAQTTTWHNRTPFKTIRIADDKRVWKASMSVTHASCRAPGLQTSLM